MARTRAPAPLQEAPPQMAGSAAAAGLPAQDLLGNALLASQLSGAGADGPARDDITRLTPEYVEAHRAELGIPEEAPIEDFFYEFVAKSLATQDMSKQDATDPSLSAEDRARILARQQLLESWGYQGTVSADQEIIDPETGLYAVRFDPLEGEAGRGRSSVLAFRGTEAVVGDELSADNPLGVFNDVLTDFGPSVGSRQYEANAEAIRALLEGGTDTSVLTGHSLGGYLAQRVAAENADKTDSVVTFQAGGIDEGHADRFEEANADGHIDVRHHQTNWDVVHLAGEQRLDGTFFQHNADGPRSAHALYLMYDDQDATSLVEAAGSKDMVTTHDDPVPRWQRGLAEGLRAGVGGVGQVFGSPLVGLWNLGGGLADAGQNAVDGLSRTGGEIWNGLSGGANTAWEGMTGAWDQIQEGDWLGGLGSLGGGLLRGGGEALGGLWGGATSLLDTGAGLVSDTGQALWNGITGTTSTLLGGGQQLLSAGENLLEAGWDGLGNATDAAMDGLGSLAGGAADLLTSW